MPQTCTALARLINMFLIIGYFFNSYSGCSLRRCRGRASRTWTSCPRAPHRQSCGCTPISPGPGKRAPQTGIRERLQNGCKGVLCYCSYVVELAGDAVGGSVVAADELVDEGPGRVDLEK